MAANDIHHIFNVAVNVPCHFGIKDGYHVYRCGLIDGPGNPLAQYYAAILMLHGIAENNKVLVHCWAGRSRSVFVTACYLVVKGDFAKMDDAVAFVMSKRHHACILPPHRDIVTDERLQQLKSLLTTPC